MEKKKKKTIALIIILTMISILMAFCLFIGVYFFWFYPVGYRMIPQWHGYTEVADNVYVAGNWYGNTDKVLKNVEEARERVKTFYGETKSNPKILFCNANDKKETERLGGDHDTKTFVFGEVYSCVALSSNHSSTDIIAHELTHAETHYRVLKGKFLSGNPLPAWFDEGLAMQNDFRVDYNEEKWNQITDNGTNITDIKKETNLSFYDSAETIEKYCLAKHEVAEWISANGKDSLYTLLEDMNKGKNFSELYDK